MGNPRSELLGFIIGTVVVLGAILLGARVQDALHIPNVGYINCGAEHGADPRCLGWYGQTRKGLSR